MQMQNQQKVNNKIKKSQTLIFGSLLVFGGIVFLSWNYFLRMRDEVYSDMRISMMDQTPPETQQIVTGNNEIIVNDQPVVEEQQQNYTVDYSKYLGVLEIPKIGLKRGFYNTDSKYNNIQYNVTLVDGSSMPDVTNGNLILMAHSGDAYISYFAFLYKLNIGDDAYITYYGNKYHYQIVNIYEVPKIGAVTINRNMDRTTLTMITCTKDNDYLQTIYIAELVD
jgi:LPXTG-site transpeptidase (sortase) family protein